MEFIGIIGGHRGDLGGLGGLKGYRGGIGSYRSICKLMADVKRDRQIGYTQVVG